MRLDWMGYSRRGREKGSCAVLEGYLAHGRLEDGLVFRAVDGLLKAVMWAVGKKVRYIIFASANRHTSDLTY